jgi:hypothetical protein
MSESGSNTATVSEISREAGFVFVVYRCNGEWNHFKDFIGTATDPSDLTFRIDGQR